MQFQARFGRVEATRARLEDYEPDTVYVLFNGGKACAVVEADAFEALFEPIASTNGHTPKAAVAKKEPSAAKPAKPSAAAPAAPSGGMTAREFCLLVLKKKPLTSGEVFDAAVVAGYKGAIGSVYSALHAMKGSGELDSRNEAEEEGGLRKWYVVAK